LALDSRNKLEIEKIIVKKTRAGFKNRKPKKVK
jgi:hypothetical protein